MRNNNRPNKHMGQHRNQHRRNNNKFRSGGHTDSMSLARQKKDAQAKREKYTSLAMDAQRNGERVEAEYYWQHVDHYNRVIAEVEAQEPKPEPRPQYDANAEGGEAASGEEGGEGAAAAPQQHQPRERGERQHHDRPRRERNFERREQQQAQSETSEGEAPRNADIPLPQGIFGEPEETSKAS